MKKYTLLEPIHFGEEVYRELELTPPRVKQLMQLDEVKGDGKIALAAKTIEICANIPAPVVKEMSFKDFSRVQELINDFLE